MTEAGFLTWTLADGVHDTRRRIIRSGSGLLEDFVDLADLDGSALLVGVRRYAKRWGVLNLCDHALPASHALVCSRRSPLRPSPRPGWIAAWREPIEGWHAYARKARTLLRLAARIERGDLGFRGPRQAEVAGFMGSGAWVGENDWVGLYSRPRFEQIDDQELASVDENGHVLLQGRPVEHEHVNVRGRRANILRGDEQVRRITKDMNTVSAAANAWVRLASVAPQLGWRDGRPLIRIAGGSLFSALGTQILLRIGHAESLALCGGCPRVILHARRAPRSDQSTYCDECRAKGVSGKRAKQKYRARRRAAGP